MDLKERVKKAIIPTREDGLPDCDNWGPYVNQIGFKNLGEMIDASRYDYASYGGILIRKAIHHRETEIVIEIIKTFQLEGLTIREAIDLLGLVEKKILDLELESLNY